MRKRSWGHVVEMELESALEALNLLEMSSQIIRIVCFEGFFVFPQREVRMCAMVSKAWREALKNFPVDDIMWREPEWVRKCFPATQKFWRLRSLRLTVPLSSASNSFFYGARSHRLDLEVSCPLTGIHNSLRHLVTLNLSNEFCKVSSLAGLKVCRALQCLDLGIVKQHNLSFLQNCERLETLRVLQARAVGDISALGKHCKNLKHLVLRHCVKLKNLDGIRGCRVLEIADFTGAGGIESIDALAWCFNLKKLVLICCRTLKTIDPLASCSMMETLFLSHCVSLSNIRALKYKQHLKSLWLASCLGLSGVDELATCRSLSTLSIGHCTNLFHKHLLEPLLKCPSLVELHANNLKGGILPAQYRRRGGSSSIYISTDPIFYSCSLLARYGTHRDSIYFTW
mmetsp:Transcript_37959/g.61734  ORF Transcript_37959/g.61734 Transcript_37959/m.61734 type:complete len:399 (+) Transcript_37959:431-1627(+)